MLTEATARPSALSFRPWWWAGCIALGLAGAHYALIKSMNHDVAYYVNAVGRLLDGARLYRDLIDVNVPTVYGVMALPVWLSRRLGIAPTLGFNVFVLICAALSTWAVYRAARRVMPDAGMLPDILAGVLLIGFLVMPGFDFGQREHLAAMALAPYAVCRAGMRPYLPGLGFRAAVGILAGIGMALKPHLGLVVLGMELALVLRRGWRSWRPGLETVLLALTAGACAAATVLFLPEYRQQIVPLARAVYGGFEASFWRIVVWGQLELLAAAAVALVVSSVLDRRIGDLTAILVGGAVGGYAAFLQQSKGWHYQLLPTMIFSNSAFALALAGRVLRGSKGARASRILVGTTAIVAGLGLGAAVYSLMDDYRSDAKRREFFASTVRVVRQYAEGGPALFISADVDYTFPGVNYAGATYPYRWHHLLPLPGLYRTFAPGPDGRLFHTPEEMNSIEREFFESFIDDTLKYPPRIVLVDRRPGRRPGLSPDIDLFAYFCQSPRFADLMRGYHWLGRRGFYDVLVPSSTLASPGPCGGPKPSFDGDANS
jgi:hypothetical protein